MHFQVSTTEIIKLLKYREFLQIKVNFDALNMYFSKSNQSIYLISSYDLLHFYFMFVDALYVTLGQVLHIAWQKCNQCIRGGMGAEEVG